MGQRGEIWQLGVGTMLYFLHDLPGFEVAALDITITLPEELSERARKMASEMGINIDQFLALIIVRYVNDRPGAMVTETLNEVYEKVPSTLDPVLAKLQSLSIATDEW
jgi:hypothetical protein